MPNLLDPNQKVIIESYGVKEELQGKYIKLAIWTLNATKQNYTVTYKDGTVMSVVFNPNETCTKIESKTKKELENEISKYKHQINALENLHGTKSKEKFELQEYYKGEIQNREGEIERRKLLSKSILNIPVKAEIVTLNHK